MREFLLILHILGVALGVGVSFAHLILGISRSKMEPEAARKDAMRALSLSLMGDIGIILLLLSGIFLMGPYWSALFSTPLLMAKLALVILLVVLLIVIKINVSKIKKGNTEAASVLEKLGKFTLPLGIIIIILAVIIFK